MKKIIIIALLALPSFSLAAPTLIELYQQAENALSEIPKYESAAQEGDTQAQTYLGMTYLAIALNDAHTKTGIEWLTKASNQGDANAQFLLGSFYLNGRLNVKVDFKQAEKWLLKSANQGQDKAQTYLANTYYSGGFGQVNYVKARYWYETAAKQGQLEAVNNLGWMLMNGKGGKQDIKTGFELVDLAASSGYDEAQYNLGVLYSIGSYGIDQDIEKAKMWLTRALKTIPEAQETLDKLPKQNQRVSYATSNSQELFEQARKELNDYNHKSALPKLKKAAGMGNTQAQSLLGMLYLAGSVINRDAKLGIDLLTKASNQGNATAQFTLGSIYLKGSYGIKTDPKLAEKWLLQSAEQQDKTAQLYLGNAYYRGNLGQKNLKKARYWYEKASKHGELAAMQKLGWMTLIGEGGKKDETKGFLLISKAASQGYDEAQYILGLLYANGVAGAPKDIEKAKVWLTKALKTIPEAQEALDKLPKQKNKQAQIEINYTERAYLAFKEKEYDIAKVYALKAIEQNNDATAQYLLGGVYFFGNGELKNYQQAVYWLKKSANQNFSAAQLMLGKMYLYGNGVTQNFEKAYHWLLKAAQQNDDLAQFEIAKMYATGKGVKQDNKRFIDWLFKAAANGNKEAQDILKQIKN